MSLWTWLRGGGAPRRRRKRPRGPGGYRGASGTRSAAAERELIREQIRLEARQTAQAAREQHRLERRDQQQRIRRMRHEGMLVRRAAAAQDRERRALEKQGFTPEEIDEVLTHYDVNPNPNPGERLAIALGTLGLALASGVHKNPTIGAAVDPHALEQSERFHGTRRDTAALQPRERQALPRDVVVIGQLESVSYRPLRGSKRGGAIWEHEIGDRGFLQPRATRKPLLVADPHTHRAEIVGGAMKFDPSRGLVG